MIRARLVPGADQPGILVNARQRGAVEAARGHLLRGVENLPCGVPELAAEELRLATAALDRLVGRIRVEDVLDEVFAGFCLGK